MSESRSAASWSGALSTMTRESRCGLLASSSLCLYSLTPLPHFAGLAVETVEDLWFSRRLPSSTRVMVNDESRAQGDPSKSGIAQLASIIMSVAGEYRDRPTPVDELLRAVSSASRHQSAYLQLTIQLDRSLPSTPRRAPSLPLAVFARSSKRSSTRWSRMRRRFVFRCGLSHDAWLALTLFRAHRTLSPPSRQLCRLGFALGFQGPASRSVPQERFYSEWLFCSIRYSLSS